MKVFVLAWQGIRSEPVKSALTVVALTLGLLGIVSVVAAQAVLTQAITQRALAQGGPVATYALTVSGPADLAAIERLEAQLVARTGATSSTSYASVSDIEVLDSAGVLPQLGLRFVEDDVWEVRPVAVVDGDWLPQGLALAPRLVLNTAAAKEVATSKELSVRSSKAQLSTKTIGVVDDGETGGYAYLSLGWLLSFHRIQDADLTIVLTAASLERSEIVSAVAALQGLGADFELINVTRTDTVEELQREVAATSRVLLALGALGLASAIAAVMNIGLATARTRAREYALRRTLGASRSQITWVTVVESQMIGVVAAAVSIGLAYALLPVVVGLFSPPAGLDTPGFSWYWAVFALVLSALASLLASLLPAAVTLRRDNSAVMRE